MFRGCPKIEFLCRPEDKGVIAEPVPAKTVLPDWFRKLPAHRPGALSPPTTGLTVKRCMPFFDALATGWIMPLAATVRLEIRDEGRTVEAGWEFDREMVSNHGPHQVAGHPRSRARRASSTTTGRSARHRAGAACSCRRSTGATTSSNASPGSSTRTPYHAHDPLPVLRRSGPTGFTSSRRARRLSQCMPFRRRRRRVGGRDPRGDRTRKAARGSASSATRIAAEGWYRKNARTPRD